MRKIGREFSVVLAGGDKRVIKRNEVALCQALSADGSGDETNDSVSRREMVARRAG